VHYVKGESEEIVMPRVKMREDAGIYGYAAKWYDKNTRSSRLAEMKKYADLIASYVPDRAAILEVAPGPGYLSIELAKRGYNVTGIELSQDFVEIEKRNARDEGVSVNFLEGNASKLPLDDGLFDGIICSAAFKNFKEPVTALCEMYRVLRPDGVALIIDMNHDATSADMAKEVQDMKGFDRWFVKLSFRTFLSRSAYTADDFESMIADTPFGKGEIIKEGMSLFVTLRKSNGSS
jgi:ubiquinone/menaquinone biosynthesis C-methylase UbiE